MADFKGKVVICTGTSSGIGEATAQLFLSHGAKVAALDVVDNPNPPTSEDLLRIKCDVSSEEAVNAAIKQVLDKWSTIDIAVNVAGILDRFERISDVSTETFTRVLSVNLHGPFNVSRAVIQHFLTKEIEQKGRIVNVGSLASIKGGVAGLAYTTSKHALLGLSRNTAWMYAKQGIQTNILLPGGVVTNLFQNSRGAPDPVGMEAVGPSMLTRIGDCEPVDCAHAILFLASAVGLNGSELVIDKGWATA